jgi:hypothetical protein
VQVHGGVRVLERAASGATSSGAPARPKNARSMCASLSVRVTPPWRST